MKLAHIVAVAVGVILAVYDKTAWWLLLIVPLHIALAIIMVAIAKVMLWFTAGSMARRVQWDIGLPGAAVNAIEYGFQLVRAYDLKDAAQVETFARALYGRIRRRINPKVTEEVFMSLVRVGRRMALDGPVLDTKLARAEAEEVLRRSGQGVGSATQGEACGAVEALRGSRVPGEVDSKEPVGGLPSVAPIMMASRFDRRDSSSESSIGRAELMRLIPAANYWSSIARAWLPTAFDGPRGARPATGGEAAIAWVGRAIEHTVGRLLSQVEALLDRGIGIQLEQEEREALKIVAAGLGDLSSMDIRALLRLRAAQRVIQGSGFSSMEFNWWCDVFSGDGLRQAAAINEWMASLPGVLAAKLGDASAFCGWKSNHPELNNLNIVLEVEAIKSAGKIGRNA